MKPVVLSALLVLATPAAAQTLADVRESGDREFATADGNRDGVVTRKEMSRRLVQRYGKRAQAEGLTPDQARIVVDRFFTKMDMNRDGRVTRAEARRATDATFRRFDANGNDRIDPDERRRVRTLLLNTTR